MKLSQALKEKNRLAGEVVRLKNIINRENSRDVTSTSKVDVPATWAKLQETIEALVKIKSAIFNANAGIYDKITRIGELKGMAAWIPTVNTQDCLTEQPYGMGSATIKREIKAWMTQEKADEHIVSLQAEIAKLQDEIDTYNATISVHI